MFPEVAEWDPDDVIQLTPRVYREPIRWCVFCGDAVCPAWERRPRAWFCVPCAGKVRDDLERNAAFFRASIQEGNP